MGLFQQIQASARERGLDFLVKDFQDVVGLVRVNHLDLKSERMRQMFLKYGTEELYQKTSDACAHE